MSTRNIISNLFCVLLVGGCMAAAQQITSASVRSFYAEPTGNIVVTSVFKLVGTGFAPGQTVSNSFGGGFVLPQGTSSIEIDIAMNVTSSTNSGWLDFWVVNSDGTTSNTVTVAVCGPVGTLTRLLDSTLVNLGSGGLVNLFTSEGVFSKSMMTLRAAFALAPAASGQENFMISTMQGQQGGVSIFALLGYAYGGELANVNANVGAVSSLNGVGVALLPYAPSVAVFDATNLWSPSPVFVSDNACPWIEPWTVTMQTGTDGVTTYASVYDRQATMVCTFVVTATGATLKSAVSLAGTMERRDQFTANGAPLPAGWFSASASTGKSAQIVAIKAPHHNADNSIGTRVVFVNGETGSVLPPVDLTTPVGTPNAISTVIASAEVSYRPRTRRGFVDDGNFVVAWANPDARSALLESIDPATGVVVVLPKTTTVFPSGLQIDSLGNVYVASGSQVVVLSSAEPKPR